MAGEVKEVGNGFFKADGTLRTGSFGRPVGADEISGTNAKTEQSSQADEYNVTANALGQIRGRTNLQINNAIDTVHDVRHDVQRASQVVKEQEQVLQKLQDEEDPPTPEKTDALKRRYAELDAKRRQLAQEINGNNQERQIRGPDRISVGNQTVGSFSAPTVKFQASAQVNLDDPKEIRAALKELKQDQKSLTAQKTELNEMRSGIADAAKEARSEIRRIAEQTTPDYSPIERIGEATALANSTRDNILANAAQALSAFNPTQATRQLTASLFG